MRKLSDTIKKRAQVVEFQKPSERELTTWIARHFRAEGKTISDKLAGYLIFLTGGGMTQLEGEIKKISSYASGEEIQRSDIDAVVTPVLNAQTFDISNAIAGGNFQLALTKLQELFAMQAEPSRFWVRSARRSEGSITRKPSRPAREEPSRRLWN